MPDATSVLNEISGALSSLATQIQSLFPESPSFAEIWNWQQPGITRDDLFDRVQHTISGINLIEDKTEVNQQIFDRLSRYPATISFVQSNTLPNSASANSYFGYISIVSMLDAIDLLTVSLRPKEPDWQEIQDKNLFPAQLKKRLDTLNRGITNVEGQTSNLAAKIQIINEAHQAANALPASLAGLEDARTKFELSGKEITAIRLNVDESHQDIAIYKDNIEKLLFISKELTANIDSVYSAATRQGLGKSFQERADSLKNSTYTLMFILAICLAVAGKISHDRIKVVEQLLASANLNLQVLWANVALTAVGVAAPIWFAWLLTRQISQRFRLAEDYGFKASVAKAYEGYRREAQEIGNLELQTRLLSIALDRVQEDPLKQLEREESSSPIHDLISKLARSRGSNAESNGEKA
jgi:hypothetical protein